jgi:hypothetical protein
MLAMQQILTRGIRPAFMEELSVAATSHAAE